MSRAAEIDYEAISLQCDAICNIAKTEVSKIDKLISSINEKSSELLTDSIISYQKELLKEKQSLLSDIDLLLKESEILKSRGRVSSYDDASEYSQRNRVVELARNLEAKANNLSTNKIQVIEHLVNEELFEIGSNIKEKLIKESMDIREINNEILAQINSIEDVTLRESTLIVARLKENEDLKFSELLEKGTIYLSNLTNNIKENNKQKMMLSIKSEMLKANVTSEIVEETINENISIDEMRKKATSNY